MIIVEGTDGVGKTTLCKKLLEALPGHVYAHFTRLPSEFDYYWGYAGRVSPGVVQDRFHMSEVAYARARGEVPRLDLDGYALVDAEVRRVGGVTVVLVANEELVKTRWDRSQMYDLETTLAAGRIFADVVSRPGLYRADVDFHFHLDEGNPYVDRHAVDTILEGYGRRQAMVRRLVGRRPPHL